MQGVSFIRRAGLLGDLHGHDATLATALDYLRSVPDLDALLCTGDVPGALEDGDTDLCCRLLAENGVLTVRGNHDSWAIENADERVLLGISDHWPLAPESIEYLRTLPITREFDTPRGPLLIGHGTGDDDLTGVYPGDIGFGLESNHALNAIYGEGRIQILVGGHTHQRMVRQLDHLTIVNPAALSCEKDASVPARISPGTALRHKNPCFSVLDLEAGKIQFYNIDLTTLTVTEAESFAL